MQPRFATNTGHYVVDDRAVNNRPGVGTAGIEPAGGGSRP